MPGTLNAASDTVLRVGGCIGGSRVLALWSGVELIDGVSGSSSSNVIDLGSVVPQALLLGKLLIKAEDGTLLLAVDVAGTSTARGKVGIGWWRREGDAGSRTSGVGTIGNVLGVDAGDVASATSSGVENVGGRDGWMRLGDAVGRHYDIICGGGDVVAVDVWYGCEAEWREYQLGCMKI